MLFFRFRCIYAVREMKNAIYDWFDDIKPFGVEAHSLCVVYCTKYHINTKPYSKRIYIHRMTEYQVKKMIKNRIVYKCVDDCFTWLERMSEFYWKISSKKLLSTKWFVYYKFEFSESIHDQEYKTLEDTLNSYRCFLNVFFTWFFKREWKKCGSSVFFLS